MASLGTSVFSEVNRLAALHGAINLGQGAPSFDGPDFIKEAAVEAIRAGRNQYARAAGVPELTRAIADHQARFYGLSVDPEAEVTVFAGATEALFAAFQAFIDPGDEVILFEPFYDSYLAGARMAGAEVKAVTLHAPDYAYDHQALARAISPSTKLLVLNTPHNPTGKVFDRAELLAIASLALEHDLIVLADEVYEHLVFAGEHVPISSLPGMRERTVTISSTGKTFSLTGWKIGYTTAAPELTAALRGAHQFITFCQATPLQYAMAAALATSDDYYRAFLDAYRARRDRLTHALAAAGFGVAAPAGTYFVLADIRPLGFTDDVAFCTLLPERYGVAAVPPSSFYLHPEHGRHLVRFAFCKDEAVLDAAAERLLPLAELAAERA